MTHKRINMFSIDIDVLDMNGAVDVIEGWLREETRACRYVVTPNVDHVVKLKDNADFRAAYRDASLVLADGKPILLSSRLLGMPLPGTVPGSDLVPALFMQLSASGSRPANVYLLGSAPGVAERAKNIIESKWPGVKVAGLYSPPMGFERDAAECEKIVALIANSNADILLIGLGAPKQELWVHRFAARLPVKAALCIGATIDFIAGEKARAPQWMRTTGLEWLHRMLSEPKRLVKRYLHDALAFPGIFLAELRKKRGNV